MSRSAGSNHPKPRIIAAVALVIALIVLPIQPVDASSGIRTFWWHSSNFPLSTAQNPVSNAVGFWQVILSANTCGLAIDGLFGTQTHNRTLIQQSQLGLTQDGVVGVATFHATQTATFTDAQGFSYPRLNPTGYVDGYGTEHYLYYGGQAYNSYLGWNSFVPQWLFDPYILTDSPTLHATSARTMGTYPGC